MTSREVSGVLLAAVVTVGCAAAARPVAFADIAAAETSRHTGGPALIVWALHDRRGANGSPEAPLTILQRRYARGDISTEEYERMRTTLAS